MRRFMNAEYFEGQRLEMVAAVRAIADHVADELGKTALDERVLRAMAKVPRHEFVPVEVQSYAYLNRPIPIGFDKTISQPLMIAVMTDLLELKADDMVLEIGTGLGYQSEVLAELAGTVASLPAALAALSNLLNKRDSRFFFKKPLFPDICSEWCDNVRGMIDHEDFSVVVKHRAAA